MHPAWRMRWKWKATFTAVAISGGIFATMADLLANLQVLGFNERYASGIYLGKLPLGAYLLFVTAPLLALNLYERIKRLPQPGAHWHRGVTWFILSSSIFLGVYFYPRMLSSSGFLMVAAFYSFQMLLFKSAWMPRFYGLLIALVIPWLVLGTWLCGGFTEEPLLVFSDFESIGIRLFYVPIEGVAFALAYLLLLIGTYERSLFRKHAYDLPNMQDDYI